jgi:hypothetical protein
MAAEQRKLLQQLMGSDSLDPRQSNRREIDLLDPKLCKGFLIDECLYDLLANTKQDIGSCQKVHSEQAKLEYKAQINRGREFPEIELEYERDLERYVQECNRRVEAANQRLEKTPEDIAKINEATKELEKINTALAWGLQEVELLGSMGEIIRAAYEFQKLDDLWKEQEAKERDIRALSEQSGFAAHQKLQVCQTCGAFLSRLDTDKRLAEHFLGKLHMGYVRLREAYEEMKMKKRESGFRREKRRRD